MKFLVGVIVLGLLATTAATASAQVELRNDGFNDGDSVAFESGFHAAEIGASRYVAPSAGLQLLTVRLLFGGVAANGTITLHVWDDTAGTTAPGAELYSGDFQLTGSNSAISEIDLSGEAITVTQQFRVGIEFQADGLPSIARDDDGTITASRNFILAEGLGWAQSSTLGLTGDWIIRAVVSGGGGGTPDAGVSDAPDAGAAGGACSGNGSCAIGSYCDTTDHVCTFDCREDLDCSAGSCNSLGQCVDGAAPGGCCDSGGSAPVGVTTLGLIGLAFTLRRRRS